MMSPAEKDPAAAAAAKDDAADADADGADDASPGAVLHWTYSIMANALLLFLVHPKIDAREMARLAKYAMSCLLGPSKTLRLPAACALLMISRYDAFHDAGSTVVRDVLAKTPRAVEIVLKNIALCHHVEGLGGGDHGGHGGGLPATSRADALTQAAENLYGAGGDMSGAPWPKCRGAEIATHGCFVTACARAFRLFFSVAPEVLIGGAVERAIKEAIATHGDRGARCAAAEALAGILASTDPSPETIRWASATLHKSAMEAPADDTEEWLRAVRYVVRGGNELGGEEEDGDYVTAASQATLDLIAAPLDARTATVAWQSRRFELASQAIAELASPLTGVSFQGGFLREMLAPGEASPLASDARPTREEAAKVAAHLIASHAGPHVADDESVGRAELRALAHELLDEFVARAPRAVREALAANPAETAAAIERANAAVNAGVPMDLDAPPPAAATPTTADARAPPGRGQSWLEGVFLTVIQLAKGGDAGSVAVASRLASLLPSALRAQEAPDRDFALVAKRALTHLKYVVFPGEAIAGVVRGIHEGLSDAQWHARAAALKFTQAFAFRHAFALSGAFYTLVPIRPRWRGERRSLRTLPGSSVRPALDFNTRPRRLSTPTDAFQLHPDIRSYGTALRRGPRRSARRGVSCADGRADRSPAARGGVAHRVHARRVRRERRGEGASRAVFESGRGRGRRRRRAATARDAGGDGRRRNVDRRLDAEARRGARALRVRALRAVRRPVVAPRDARDARVLVVGSVAARQGHDASNVFRVQEDAPRHVGGHEGGVHGGAVGQRVDRDGARAVVHRVMWCGLGGWVGVCGWGVGSSLCVVVDESADEKKIASTT